MTTIRDVASAAQVSTATVSRVINNDQKYKMKDDTRARVWKAISQTGYKVAYKSHNAPEPATAENRNIGCIISVTKDKYQDPYFMRILSGIEYALNKKGFTLAFVTTHHELADSDSLRKTFKEPLAGLILMEKLYDDIYYYVSEQVPIRIGIDTQYTGIDNVGYNHFETAEQAVRYLLSKGHERIAFTGGGEFIGDTRNSKRFSGYAFALLTAGLPLRSEWIMDCQWDEKLCIRQIKDLMSSGQTPTAIFAASDLMAIAVLSALYSMGINVPDDVAVMGLSNIELSEFTSPPLTTFHIPAFDIGVTAVDLLERRLRDNTLPSQQVYLPTHLVERSSV